jgi:hypothetical protein
MSRKTKQFDAFGQYYRTIQFSAAEGLSLMERMLTAHPCEMLAHTEARGDDGEWQKLNERDSVNALVIDKANALPPMMVLEGIVNLIRDFNFGFLTWWQSVKIPKRFVDGTKGAKSENIDPMLAQLIQEDVATLKELEEYYSMEDAFKMFDVIIVKGVNSALANEAAMKDSKKKR